MTDKKKYNPSKFSRIDPDASFLLANPQVEEEDD